MQAQVRDLFLEKDLGVFEGSFSASVRNHGVLALRISPLECAVKLLLCVHAPDACKSTLFCKICQLQSCNGDSLAEEVDNNTSCKWQGGKLLSGRCCAGRIQGGSVTCGGHGIGASQQMQLTALRAVQVRVPAYLFMVRPAEGWKVQGLVSLILFSLIPGVVNRRHQLSADPAYTSTAGSCHRLLSFDMECCPVLNVIAPVYLFGLGAGKYLSPTLGPAEHRFLEPATATPPAQLLCQSLD